MVWTGLLGHRARSCQTQNAGAWIAPRTGLPWIPIFCDENFPQNMISDSDSAMQAGLSLSLISIVTVLRSM